MSAGAVHATGNRSDNEVRIHEYAQEGTFCWISAGSAFGIEVTVGAALRGAAAIMDAEKMHILLTWLKSILVQSLYTHKLHSWCLSASLAHLLGNLENLKK